MGTKSTCVPGAQSVGSGFGMVSAPGGLNAAFAVMAALYHRERTGEGQFIDVALLDSIMPLMGWVVANLMIGGQQPVLMGNENFTAAPSGVFRTRDGYINIAANKQEQWESVADVLGLSAAEARIVFPEPRTLERGLRTLEEIGRCLSLTRERVRQIEVEALRQL